MSDSLTAFREKWAKLPPLVRASVGVQLYDETMARFKSYERVTGNARGLMPRRERVSHMHMNASLILAELFCALTNEADAEATALGLGPLDAEPKV